MVEASKEKSSPKRFLGWQKTPAAQASFGRTTQGGRVVTKFQLLHSTGAVTTLSPSWYLIDASEAPIGQLASVAATLLMGKHRATFTPGAGSGDGVIIVNASKAFFTSDKADKKIYYDHSRWMGGLKSKSARDALKDDPAEVLWLAVQGMMPKNKLSRYQLSHLKIHKGAEHTQKAQKPIKVDVSENPLKKLTA